MPLSLLRLPDPPGQARVLRVVEVDRRLVVVDRVSRRGVKRGPLWQAAPPGYLSEGCRGGGREAGGGASQDMDGRSGTPNGAMCAPQIRALSCMHRASVISLQASPKLPVRHTGGLYVTCTIMVLPAGLNASACTKSHRKQTSLSTEMRIVSSVLSADISDPSSPQLHTMHTISPLSEPPPAPTSEPRALSGLGDTPHGRTARSSYT